jgi:hypothetical protein
MITPLEWTLGGVTLLAIGAAAYFGYSSYEANDRMEAAAAEIRRKKRRTNYSKKKEVVERHQQRKELAIERKKHLVNPEGLLTIEEFAQLYLTVEELGQLYNEEYGMDNIIEDIKLFTQRSFL